MNIRQPIIIGACETTILSNNNVNIRQFFPEDPLSRWCSFILLSLGCLFFSSIPEPYGTNKLQNSLFKLQTVSLKGILFPRRYQIYVETSSPQDAFIKTCQSAVAQTPRLTAQFLCSVLCSYFVELLFGYLYWYSQMPLRQK